jgi:squalene-hopene/tetraprenyl-beta-curcumene cyclase
MAPCARRSPREPAGQRRITTSDGEEHEWPVELADKILSLQHPDGSWVNTNGWWLGSDSILVTSYIVRALSICYDVIH